MSLRVRLTLLYVSIVGGILILFSAVIYGLVTLTLLAEVDDTLERTWEDVQRIARVSASGRLEFVTSISFNPNVFIQAWDRNGNRIGATISVSQLERPLDEQGLHESGPVFRDVFIDSVHLRVLSVPFLVGGRPFGTVQIGANMTVVDGTLQDLLRTLTIVSLVAIVLSGTISWIATYHALRPLDLVTQAALQITETIDLSRRIPQTSHPNDEVGQLVRAFNLNLSRLERLIETQRRFMADVGHELRTPLTVIKGNIDLMRRIGADEEFFQSIESEVDRLTRLVGDLILLAQAETGKLPMDSQVVDLDTVLLEVFRQMKVLAKDQIRLKIGEIDQVLVCGDRDRLKQVLVNLISNGIKYTPPGGQVTVSLGKKGNYARLVVSDTGPGIPEEDLPYIFERFYRGEKSRMRSKDGKGFGLGLSIAYWIVRHHQGRIEVASKEGEGTTFCVWLPLVDGECEGEE